MRLRPWIPTTAFVVLFAIIANLAWLTAIGTTAPWFGTAVSLQAYGVSVVVASLLAIALVLSASSHASRLDLRMLWLDGRIAFLRSAPASGNSSRPPAEPAEDLDLGTGFEEDLAEIRADPMVSVVGLDKQGHDTLLELPGMRTPAVTRRPTDLLRELVRARVLLRETRASLWRTVAGPVIGATLFVAMAGVMIPGSEGFAAAHYQLNTALVLFLGYGIGPLVAWTVLALAALGAEASHPTA